MSNIKINIDAADLAKQIEEFAKEIENDIRESMKPLSRLAHQKMVDLASQELDSTREAFLDNLAEPTEISEGVWVITLEKGGLFIEDGLTPGFDMKPGLLTNGKYSEKTGYRYRVVPFEHGKPPSQVSQSAKELIGRLRQGIKDYNKANKTNIPWKKIERNSDGSPKIGKLHSLNLPSQIPGKGNTPELFRVSIYQSMQNGNPRRDITTFRTVTSNPEAESKWIHPGIDARKIMNDAADWAEKEFYSKIWPEILNKWK